MRFSAGDAPTCKGGRLLFAPQLYPVWPHIPVAQSAPFFLVPEMDGYQAESPDPMAVDISESPSIDVDHGQVFWVQSENNPSDSLPCVVEPESQESSSTASDHAVYTPEEWFQWTHDECLRSAAAFRSECFHEIISLRCDFFKLNAKFMLQQEVLEIFFHTTMKTVKDFPHGTCGM